MILNDFCYVNPRIQHLPEYDMKPDSVWSGIKAIFYDGANYKGQKTKVFAHIGFPKMKKGEKVPAIVLVHGGGGHAFPEWIRIWNERGFAAIAMDTTGFVPKDDKKGLLSTETHTMKDDYIHELYGDLCEDGYTLGPDKKDMLDYDLPLDEQWMYHAVADTILAHNILRNDDRVDNTKIGITGISWGSVITSIAIGYDNRYAFAIPIYGSGYLDFEPSPKLPSVFRNPAVKKLWSAADRFDKVSFPVLWKCWLHDAAFSVGATNLSYLATKNSGSLLSMSIKMCHSHIDAWNSLESYRFAEGIVKGKLPLIKLKSEPVGFGEIAFDIEIPEDFEGVAAELFYLTEPLHYDENSNINKTWQSIKPLLQDNRVICTVPKDACCYFVELKGNVNGIEYLTDSTIVQK